MDNRRLLATFPHTMKCETLNGILTFVLGVLVVLGVYFALRVTTLTHETRALQNQALRDNTILMQSQQLYNDVQVYNQKYQRPELTYILQSVQAKATH